jgi:DNA-binding transcriptional LysR family regulator
VLDLQQLRSFLAVVRAGSFVGAADALGLSKAAVSRHVADLEAGLGVRLLHRTTRRLSLTEDGLRFQARAGDLVAAFEELEAETSAQGGEASGLLRINAPMTFGNLHLAPLWPRFIAANPGVSLEVTLNDRVVDLVDEGFDLAVRITKLGESSLVSRLLASTHIVLCASPGYLAGHGTPAHPRELTRHQVLAYAYWSSGDEWRFQGPEGEVVVRVHPRIRSNSGDTCLAAALQDQGIVLQPDFLVGEHLRRGALVELMPAYRSLELGIHAVYPSRKYLPMKTRRLVDFLVESFREPAWSSCIPGQA